MSNLAKEKYFSDQCPECTILAISSMIANLAKSLEDIAITILLVLLARQVYNALVRWQQRKVNQSYHQHHYRGEIKYTLLRGTARSAYPLAVIPELEENDDDDDEIDSLEKDLNGEWLQSFPIRRGTPTNKL